MDLQSYLMQSESALTGTDAIDFAAQWSPKLIKKTTSFALQNHQDLKEYILLHGRVVSLIVGTEGQAVCVGMYTGPCTITPNLARSGQNGSRVSLVATSDSLITQLNAAHLVDLMLTSASIRAWANAVMHQELNLKADREWCLAALKGADRLAWFRTKFPEHENNFSHSHIASYLGMTPVTLSRLRNLTTP
ncbi:MAG: Crp/Fnr family transcriptional regulator [Cognatishimia sp.]